MAKKLSAGKKSGTTKRKSAKKSTAARPRQTATSTSVLGGAMQDVIRSSFLKR